MKQYIKDMASSLIEVTDLQVAIRSIATYLGLLHEQARLTRAKADLLEQKYWKDLYSKLCLLRESNN